MDKLSQEIFTVNQFTVDGYSCQTITLLHNRGYDALHQNGHAVCYSLDIDPQGTTRNISYWKITTE